MGVGRKESGLVFGASGISDAGSAPLNAVGKRKSKPARERELIGAAREAEVALCTHLSELGSAESRPEHVELVLRLAEVTHLSTRRATLEEGRAASG